MQQFCELLQQRQGDAVKKTCDIATSTIRVLLTELLKLAVDLVSENFVESVGSIESFELRNKAQRQVVLEQFDFFSRNHDMHLFARNLAST
jgi:hypothetical protein